MGKVLRKTLHHKLSCDRHLQAGAEEGTLGRTTEESVAEDPQ